MSENGNDTTSKPAPTSSVPPLLPKEAEGLYRDVLLLLNERNIPYAVSGAFALREYTNICRITKDLDLFLTSENAMRALACLADQGFETEVCDPVWLAKAHQDGYYVDLITGMSNAVVVVDDSWIERAVESEIVGVPTKVLGAEELIASKLFVTRRERFDGADIAHVIYGTKGQLQWDRIVSLAGEHWEILLWALLFFRYAYPAHTDYVPQSVWLSLLVKFSRVLATPDPKARFRGSLVDDNMFAIDLHEWGLPNILEEYRARRNPKLAGERKQCA